MQNASGFDLETLNKGRDRRSQCHRSSFHFWYCHGVLFLPGMLDGHEPSIHPRNLKSKPPVIKGGPCTPFREVPRGLAPPLQEAHRGNRGGGEAARPKPQATIYCTASALLFSAAQFFSGAETTFSTGFSHHSLWFCSRPVQKRASPLEPSRKVYIIADYRKVEAYHRFRWYVGRGFHEGRSGIRVV